MAGKIMLPGTLVASIVGHIPKEISRYTRYIVKHGASVDAFVLATHHRPSPLIQGGLEVPIKLVVKLTDNEVNSAKLQKYRKICEKLKSIETFLSLQYSSVPQVHKKEIISQTGLILSVSN